MKMNYQVWVFETAMKLFIGVGGELGWDLDSDVQTWSSSRNFSVGDTLVFVYTPIHNVLEVDEVGYNACASDDPISVADDGNTTVTLDSLGNRYFICGTYGHCGAGLKAKIVVNSKHSSGSGKNNY